ncbi:MAG: hypothetical protein CL912_14325 [Deltaproteobacteria bacterium]|nr:hypothetical protein [Deltaproteobacteria bacterium]
MKFLTLVAIFGTTGICCINYTWVAPTATDREYLPSRSSQEKLLIIRKVEVLAQWSTVLPIMASSPVTA